MGTLLRDPTSSHLLESLVRHLPSSIFDVVWGIYFKGKLARLSAHPVANFVVGKALERANEVQLRDTCAELGPVSEKLFSKFPLYISAGRVLIDPAESSRTGLLRAMVDRAGELHSEDQALASLVVEVWTNISFKWSFY